LVEGKNSKIRDAAADFVQVSCVRGAIVAFKVTGLVHFFEPSGCGNELLGVLKVQMLIQEHPAVAAQTVQSAGNGRYGGDERRAALLQAKNLKEGGERENLLLEGVHWCETGYSSFIPIFQ
jgi:hypothetical protein